MHWEAIQHNPSECNINVILEKGEGERERGQREGRERAERGWEEMKSMHHRSLCIHPHREGEDDDSMQIFDTARGWLSCHIGSSGER